MQKGAQKINRIFVGGVPETTEEEMKAFFSQTFGKVSAVPVN